MLREQQARNAPLGRRGPCSISIPALRPMPLVLGRTIGDNANRPALALVLARQHVFLISVSWIFVVVMVNAIGTTMTVAFAPTIRTSTVPPAPTRTSAGIPSKPSWPTPD
jgi:hypothetical protein